MWQFYREWIKHTFRGAWGWTGGAATVLSICAAMLLWLRPNWIGPGLINNWAGWILPLLVFSLVALYRAIAAPFWIYTSICGQRDRMEGELNALHEQVRCERENRNKEVLKKAVDLISSTKDKGVGERIEGIGALLAAGADELQSECDVLDICAALEKHGHGDPFRPFLDWYGEDAFQGERLNFLREARLRGKKLRLNIHAFDFANTQYSRKDNLRAHLHAKQAADSTGAS